MSPVLYSGVLILLINVCVHCDNAIPTNPLENKLLLLLEKWRDGNVDSNIIPLPSLNSVKIPDAEHYYEGKGIKMTYVLQKLMLIGLDTFSVKEISVTEAKETLNMSISIIIPKLTLYAENYELKGRAYYLYPLKGSGNMIIDFRDSDLNLNIRFLTAVNGISTLIKDFRLDFNVNKIEANLVDSSWPINKVLSSEGVEILNGYHEEIAQAAWNYIVPYMNHHLENVTTAQMVDIVLNTPI